MDKNAVGGSVREAGAGAGEAPARPRARAQSRTRAEASRPAGRRRPAREESPIEPEVSVTAVRDGVASLVQAVEDQVHARPYVALAAAAGVGFVLSQVLGSRFGRLALLGAGGIAVSRLAQSDGLRIIEDLFDRDGDESDEAEDDEDLLASS